MAVDTQEMTQTTDEQPSENGTATRKRVDLTTLDPNEKVVLSFHVPAGLRVQLRQAAEKADVSEAEYVRNMVAKQMKYEIPDSFKEKRGRAGKYAGLSEEERKARIAADNATKREQVNKLLAAIQSGNIDTAKLQELGIDISALPKPRTEKEGE